MQVIELTNPNSRVAIFAGLIPNLLGVQEDRRKINELPYLRGQLSGLIAEISASRNLAILSDFITSTVDLSNVDFAADSVMLDIMLATGIGFDRIKVLGNVLRTFLKDLSDRGFVAHPMVCGYCGKDAEYKYGQRLVCSQRCGNKLV